MKKAGIWIWVLVLVAGAAGATTWEDAKRHIWDNGPLVWQEVSCWSANVTDIPENGIISVETVNGMGLPLNLAGASGLVDRDINGQGVAKCSITVEFHGVSAANISGVQLARFVQTYSCAFWEPLNSANIGCYLGTVGTEWRAEGLWPYPGNLGLALNSSAFLAYSMAICDALLRKGEPSGMTPAWFKDQLVLGADRIIMAGGVINPSEYARQCGVKVRGTELNWALSHNYKPVIPVLGVGDVREWVYAPCYLPGGAVHVHDPRAGWFERLDEFLAFDASGVMVFDNDIAYDNMGLVCTGAAGANLSVDGVISTNGVVQKTMDGELGVPITLISGGPAVIEAYVGGVLSSFSLVNGESRIVGVGGSVIAIDRVLEGVGVLVPGETVRVNRGVIAGIVPGGFVMGRIPAVRVAWNGAGVAVGQAVSVTGVAGGLRNLTATKVSVVGSGTIEPYCVSSAGAMTGCFGTKIKVVGRVTRTIVGEFVLDGMLTVIGSGAPIDETLAVTGVMAEGKLYSSKVEAL